MRPRASSDGRGGAKRAWLAALALTTLSTPASAASCADLFSVGGRGSTERELLLRYAPELLHWVSDDPRQPEYQDHLAAIDFDGNWAGRDNWQNAELWGESLSPVLYGTVVAVTRRQVYLLYYYFHPRDYEPGAFLRTASAWLGGLLGLSAWHENDLEGGLLVVDRGSGHIIHASALHHGAWDERHLGEAALDREPPTKLWVEAAGHGAHLFRLEEAVRPELKGARTRFIEYGPERPGRASLPGSRSGSPAQDWDAIVGGWGRRQWRYSVEPLWPLFRDMLCTVDTRSHPGCPPQPSRPGLFAKRSALGERFQGIRGSGRSDVYRAMQGDDGGVDKALFPWGEASDSQRFFNPVRAVLSRENPRHAHDPISCDYLYNPYLQSLLEGGPASWDAPGECPLFPDEAHDRRRAQRISRYCAESSRPK